MLHFLSIIPQETLKYMYNTLSLAGAKVETCYTISDESIFCFWAFIFALRQSRWKHMAGAAKIWAETVALQYHTWKYTGVPLVQLIFWQPPAMCFQLDYLIANIKAQMFMKTWVTVTLDWKQRKPGIATTKNSHWIIKSVEQCNSVKQILS